MTTANYTASLAAAKPPKQPMAIVGDTYSSSGLYLTLNVGVSVKVRSLPGLHQYYCGRCKTFWCEHVEFVDANLAAYLDAVAAPAPKAGAA